MLSAALAHRDGDQLRLPPSVHHLADLLDRSPEAVLAAFQGSQVEDFGAVIGQMGTAGAPLAEFFAELRGVVAADHPFARLPYLQPAALHELFLELHDHVMGHPVWLHPFFTRFFRAEFTRDQLVAWSQHYFNQIKNTRQCVALAIGRFHGLMGLPYGVLNERLSEITQVVLAQLVADEYGVGVHAVDDYPSLAALFGARTHIGMYRQLLDGLGLPFAEQDLPLLPEVADNVLIQRLVAGDPAFSPLESLASVGLGMEWGVPEFFSLLLGGVLRFAEREDVDLTPEHLEVLTAHVKYDVLHALSVMLATALHIRGREDVATVKNATNMLMAGRYGMMTGLYRHVFGEACPSLHEIDLAPRHRVADRRIETALHQARAAAAPECVTDAARWRAATVPVVFG
jgi:hypothetical protein